jgi:hypothetical protein
MKLISRSLLPLSILLAAAGTALAATPAKPAVSPLQPAITALLKEYQTAMTAAASATPKPADKDKEKAKPKPGAVDTGGLRDKCDYFARGKPEGLTPEAIVAALEKPVSADARAEAYVKWQLLSGLDGKFPEELRARAINVYRRAPVPVNHPGLDHAGLQRLLQRVGITKADAEPDINSEFGDVITRYRVQIEPILEYRDELYARMPPGFETLAAGLEDIYARVSHGAPANEFWTTVSAGVRSWALTSSDSAKMRQLAGAVDKLRSFVKEERNRPCYRVMWVKEDKYTGLKWVAEQTIQNDKSMEDVVDWLDEHAKNPGGGGLNFKGSEDSSKKK